MIPTTFLPVYQNSHTTFNNIRAAATNLAPINWISACLTRVQNISLQFSNQLYHATHIAFAGETLCNRLGYGRLANCLQWAGRAALATARVTRFVIEAPGLGLLPACSRWRSDASLQEHRPPPVAQLINGVSASHIPQLYHQVNAGGFSSISVNQAVDVAKDICSIAHVKNRALLGGLEGVKKTADFVRPIHRGVRSGVEYIKQTASKIKQFISRVGQAVNHFFTFQLVAAVRHCATKVGHMFPSARPE